MCVMAGFEMDEAYYVPRTEVGLPCPLEECIERLLPLYPAWKTQQESAEGDKSDYGKIFLQDSYHIW